MNEPRLSIIPGWIVTDVRLKGKDLQVLCMLGRNANTRHGWCRRSQVQLAKALDCSRSTVQAAINRLVEIGAVERREVVSASGRDSAHWYRVIYDSKVESSAFDAWDAEDEKEFDPRDTFDGDVPPAGISAPPAGPESAPPAGSGPAPINASTLTPPDQREERERERGSDDQEENPAAAEKLFKKFFLGWKTAISDSEPEARRVWAQLSAEKRVAAEARSADYQAAALSSGRKHLCSAATYLREERWEKLQEATTKAQAAVPEAYSAYSRAGRGLLLAELLRPERYLQLNALEQVIVREKPEKEELIWRDKKEKHAWPEAVRLIEITVSRKKFPVPARIVSLCQTFDKVKVGEAVWEAWKRLHHARCWPWLPAPEGLDWMQFPRLSPDIKDLDEACEQAVRDFELSMERDNDDAA